MLKHSQDGFTQDNGTFVEMIREPTADAGSPFKNERAPVLGIAHLDSNQCTRTGDPKYPVLYTDRDGDVHKMAWWQVIPFSDYPSAIERMNGVGYCAVTRALRVAQIMRSILIFKDEKISGRQYKQIHFVSGVSRQEIKDEITRGQEEANNSGFIRFILPAVLASLDPEKPVSTARLTWPTCRTALTLTPRCAGISAGWRWPLGSTTRNWRHCRAGTSALRSNR